MQISFIEPHLKLFGGIRHIIEVSNHLARRGHEVTVFHSDGAPCAWMPCLARTRPADQVLKGRHDVIIFNDSNRRDLWHAMRSKARLKVFYVLGLYERELLTGWNPRLLAVWRAKTRHMLILRICLRLPYLKLSCAPWMRDWLLHSMGIESKLVLGAVNKEMFHPVPVDRNPLEIRILCSGDPREGKGTATVLEAVTMAQKEGPRIVLDTYYGKGFPQDKMAQVYSSADIFADGQWTGGWNNPVVEAMACGVPVVCTDIGAVRDFAFHGRTALLVPPGNPHAMATAILTLVRDEPLRESLRANAYEHIQQFDWGKSAEALERILIEALAHVR